MASNRTELSSTLMTELKDAGYSSILDDEKYADKLSYVFTLLNEAGLKKPGAEFYRLIPQKRLYLDGLAIAYKTLIDAGLDYWKFEILYSSITKNAQYASQLPILFGALQALGIPYPIIDLPLSSLYHTSIEQIRFAERMATGFAALQEEGATFENNRPLLRLVIRHAPNAYQIPIALVALKKVGATIQTHPDVYLGCFSNLASAQDFSSVFTILEKAGAKFENYPNLYIKISRVTGNTDIANLKMAIDALKLAGATFKDHPLIFEQVIVKHYYTNNLASIFKALNRAGATFQNNLSLYNLILSNSTLLSNVHLCIDELAKAGAILDAYMVLYFNMLCKVRFATQLIIGIRALRDEGATVHAHNLLYDTLIQHPNYANQLPELFKSMRALGASVNEHPFFYQSGIRQAFYSSQLSAGLSALKAAGATLAEHGSLYMTSMENAQYADKLPTLFEALQAAGASIYKHRSLFQIAVEAVVFSAKIPVAISIVQNAGANPDEHQEIFRLAIQNAFHANNISAGFRALSAAGITLQAQPRLYELFIKNVLVADKLFARLMALSDNGFSYQEQPELYELVIYQTNVNSVALLDKLTALGFQPQDDLLLIIEILFSDNLDLLSWLEAHGFNRNDHYFIFENFFSEDNALTKSPYTMSKVKNQLHRYLEERPLVPREHHSWLLQCEAIQKIIDLVRKADTEITEGPLNKSEASWQIEALLQRIAVENINHVHLRFDEALGYILQFNDEPEIYLSELLKLANFNHIELSTEQIELLGDKIQAVAPVFNSMVILNNSCLAKKLPGAARRAFTCYVNNHYYWNINRFFRGVAQATDDNYAWIKPVDGRKNLIANFLTGCLMNWSAVKLPQLLHDSEERQMLKSLGLDSCSNQTSYDAQLKLKHTQGLINENEYNLLKPLFPELTILFPKYSLIDRGDVFSASEHNELCTIKRFTANKGTFTPALLSLSVFPDGHKHFHPAGSTATKIETTNSSRPIINTDEGEIIIPHGTCFGYALDISGTLFAREINSPGIVPNGGYWSSNALAEAFRNHLSKPYADDPAAQITINSIHIERPNHGLAHSYRKMVYIDIVIDYFAHHAADPAFRLFCQNASPEEREWLRVTAAYSVTGRESELSPHDNLDKYNQYKEAGKANMEAFLDKYPPANPDEAMRERMLHCVRWLGNPDYEQGAIINDHPNPEERVHRNFIHRILCVAHNLDLPRCREPEEFEQDMAVCRRLSVESVEQRDDYTRMVDYATQLIRAHGDSVGGYQAPFDKISRNLRQVREVTESVTRPLVREPYQFTTPHPQPFLYGLDRIVKSFFCFFALNKFIHTGFQKKRTRPALLIPYLPHGIS